MRQAVPGFALFGRDAGGADQFSPGTIAARISAKRVSHTPAGNAPS